MSCKQKMIAVLNRLPEDATIDRGIEALCVLKKVEIGLEQMRRGEVIDHDELFKELLDEESDADVVRASKARPRKNKKAHRA